MWILRRNNLGLTSLILYYTKEQLEYIFSLRQGEDDWRSAIGTTEPAFEYSVVTYHNINITMLAYLALTSGEEKKFTKKKNFFCNLKYFFFSNKHT